MKARVSEHFGDGHPFSRNYQQMELTQLLILDRHVREVQAKTYKRQHKLITDVLDVVFRQFRHYVDDVLMFVNIKFFKRKLEIEAQMERDKDRPPDVTPDTFEEVWSILEDIIPMEYVVTNDTGYDAANQAPLDPELEEMITGWVQQSKKFKSEV